MVTAMPGNVSSADAFTPRLVHTVGHGTRPLEELPALLAEASVRTLVDVRRLPFSRRTPQFESPAPPHPLEPRGIAYRHEVDLGGLLANEPGEERFGCI